MHSEKWRPAQTRAGFGRQNGAFSADGARCGDPASCEAIWRSVRGVRDGPRGFCAPLFRRPRIFNPGWRSFGRIAVSLKFALFWLNTILPDVREKCNHFLLRRELLGLACCARGLAHQKRRARGPPFCSKRAHGRVPAGRGLISSTAFSRARVVAFIQRAFSDADRVAGFKRGLQRFKRRGSACRDGS